MWSQDLGRAPAGLCHQTQIKREETLEGRCLQYKPTKSFQGVRLFGVTLKCDTFPNQDSLKAAQWVSG